ncbi:beta-ketoacyl synthase N-terminal-like domain-containing protein, partial [Streptomyces boncukensis]|uniref:beta-ketoacyl synthase N-terminal-like domain-containing protein n=1 Tax=Streptomyces boncukensis TaxID=2711219 RepID=UPI0030B9BCB1
MPLVLPESGSVRVQVVVGAADAGGRREVQVCSCAAPDGADGEWVCHATGTLSPEPGVRPEGFEAEAWPPAGARPVDLGGFYERAETAGYGYGPAFRGLRSVWRDGADLLAEVELPEAAGDREGYGIHPALLDAALHPGMLVDEPGEGGPLWLPFAWAGVSLWAGEARRVRVRIAPQQRSRDERVLRLTVADAAGAPVLSADSVVLRPADPDQFRTPEQDVQSLYSLDWIPCEPDASGPGPGAGQDDWAVVGPDTLGLGAVSYPGLDALLAALDAGAPAPSVVFADALAEGDGRDGLDALEYVLGLVQSWLAEPRLADARLVPVTREAVASGAPGLAGAGVWGLVRSAQAEEPGRFVLADLGNTDGADALPAIRRALAADEPQFAVRGGELLVPRVARARPRAQPEADGSGLPELDPEGTVLITGGTGVLGGLVAEHMVRTWGVRHLLLVGRRGPEAPGAQELASRLTGLGARVRVLAADVAEADQVAELVGGVDPAHPLTGVVHAAGALDDAVVASQSPERLAPVWRAKAAAAAQLHAATADLPLAAFVMFSSAASCLGSPGQGNYAAANAFCDALAAHRQAGGLPGLSVGWGLWAEASGLTGHLTEADLARLARSGSTPLGSGQALALLDAACRHGAPHLLAVVLNRRALAALPDRLLPAPLRGLAAAAAGARIRRTAADGREDTELASRLAGLDEEGRVGVLVDVVCQYVAAVLGHRSAGGVRAEAAFKEQGFDSLTAVELRNRLSAATDLRLPATLVFDHPTPRALAGYLSTRLGGRSVAPRAAPVAAPVEADEPVAIVATACRYPGGVTSAEELWDLVASGGEAIGAFPADRGWDLEGLFHPDPDHPGTSYAREGGFVHGADEFDAAFFGVNPREAVAMDPQQRLLLETSWELLERAGIDPAALRGSRTGVYAGVMYHDYGAGTAGGDAQLEGYALLSGQGSVVTGRVAYTLGLEGPAMTVDTACSSSLVAMHLAAQALRQGECSLALAGGVTVMATPDVFTGFSRQRGLAPDGRCKPFAAAADGTGWSEGVGLVLLERLSDARRNGRRVLAVLRGSAVNQDGASNGLTAPNGPSQERVIRQALAGARLAPDQVDAVEGHGTGTTLGDPIEAQALLATYGQDRSADRPLWLGSVKSNMGHTQAAAGVAGVIKMVQALRHGVLPASLHIDEPSPHVDWESGAVRLLTDPVEWPDSGRLRRAGVSSFGASGTNAHVILEQAPEPGPEAAADEPEPLDGVVPWVLSARGPEALRGQAAALAGRMAGQPEAAPAEVGWSLVSTRSQFEHRAVILGEDREQLLAGVGALAAGDVHPGVVPPAAPARAGSGAGAGSASGAGKTVFLFSGQGSQRLGMGAGLYERFPVFAAAFDEVCGHLDARLEHPLRQVVFTGSPGQDGLLDHTTYAQAGLFAVETALARLLASFGVEPDAVIGHSIGEVAAAHLAGVFDLADACRLVAARANLMGRLPAGGAMAAIQASAEELSDDIDGDQDARQLSLAALNTPDSTVISGPAEPVSRMSARWADKGRRTKALAVSHAFHSPLMEPVLEEFTQAVEDLAYHPPAIELISNLTGRPADGLIATPEYWARHIRRPVLFAPAVAHVAPEAGTFLELGPDPVLATAAQHTLDHREAADGAHRPAPLVLSALTGKQSDVQALSHSLARLHTAGRTVEWASWFPETAAARRTVDLPTYAFQRERYWLKASQGAGTGSFRDMDTAGLRPVEHPHLPAAVALADGGLLLSGRISAVGAQGWLADHQVLGSTLVPGAALAEWALRAADEADCGGVEELVLQAPLLLPAEGGVRIQIVVGVPGADRRREIRMYARPDRDEGTAAEAEWTCHAQGVLAPEACAPAGEPGAGGVWPPPDARAVSVDGFYERIAAAGHAYGPAFRGLRAVWRDGADLLAEVELPEAAGEPGGFGIHPALLDAALHPGLLADEGPDDGADPSVRLPFSWNGVSLRAGDATAVRVRLTPLPARGNGEYGVRVAVADTEGAPVLDVDSVVTRPAAADQLTPPGERVADGRFVLDWAPLPGADAGADAGADGGPSGPAADWAVLGRHTYGLEEHAERHSGLTALLEALDGGSPVPSLVLACAEPPSSADPEPDPDEALAEVQRTLELVQRWLAEPRLGTARLAVVTRGAVEAEGPGSGTVDATGAAVWGLVRSAQSENPGRFLLLDLDPGGHGATGVPEALRQAMAADEPQLAVRDGRALVPRLVRADDDGELEIPREGAWRLGMETTGTVDSVTVQPCPEALEPLEPGQVRIAVRAAGVNFRDVLIALGMYPGDGAFRGSEGAGVVLEVGAEVTRLSAGDEVMGLFEGAFASVAVADARVVVPVPEGWSWRDAAAVPVVFSTAWFGLVELAGLGAGESVLIHA